MNKILSESNEVIGNKRINTKVVETEFTKKDDELQLLQYESKLSQIIKQIKYYKNQKVDSNIIFELETKKKNIEDEVVSQKEILQNYGISEEF